jgi:dTDP-4-dehydrorhamnose reductase
VCLAQCTSADLTPLELPLTILYTHHSQSPLVLPDGPPHVTVTAGKVDLTKGEEVENMFLKCTPDVVVHTAAMSNVSR